MKRKDEEFFKNHPNANVLIRFTAKELYYFSIGAFTGDMKEFFKRTWIELRKKGELEEQSTT